MRFHVKNVRQHQGSCLPCRWSTLSLTDERRLTKIKKLGEIFPNIYHENLLPLMMGSTLLPSTLSQLVLNTEAASSGTLSLLRYGSATFLSVDDGDGDLYNASLVLEGRQLLEMDGSEGVLVGGSPEYVGATMFKVHNDFREGRTRVEL